MPDGDRATRDGGRGKDLAALLNVDEAGTASAGGATRDKASGRASEGDSAEVGEGHKASARLVVLNDPLSVLLAQSRRGGDSLRNRLAGGVVLDHSRAGGLGSGGDSDGDRVAGREGDAGEVIGVIGEPLVPS